MLLGGQALRPPSEGEEHSSAGGGEEASSGCVLTLCQTFDSSPKKVLHLDVTLPLTTERPPCALAGLVGSQPDSPDQMRPGISKPGPMWSCPSPQDSWRVPSPSPLGQITAIPGLTFRCRAGGGSPWEEGWLLSRMMRVLTPHLTPASSPVHLLLQWQDLGPAPGGPEPASAGPGSEGSGALGPQQRRPSLPAEVPRQHLVHAPPASPATSAAINRPGSQAAGLSQRKLLILSRPCRERSAALRTVWLLKAFPQTSSRMNDFNFFLRFSCDLHVFCPEDAQPVCSYDHDLQ